MLLYCNSKDGAFSNASENLVAHLDFFHLTTMMEVQAPLHRSVIMRPLCLLVRFGLGGWIQPFNPSTWTGILELGSVK